MSAADVIKRWGSALVSGLLAWGCRCSEPKPTAPTPVAAPSSSPGERGYVARPLLSELRRCDIHHHGLLLDLGSDSEAFARGFAWGATEMSRTEKSGGVSLSRLGAKNVSYSFWADRPLTDVSLTFRGRAGRSRSASVYVDDRRVGAVTLPGDALGAVSTPTLSEPIAPGHHTIGLRFFGNANPKADEVASLDWIRVGAPESSVSNYAAPTRDDVVAEIALGGVPARALVLRGSSQVRCPVAVLDGTRLRVKVGLWGTGEGTARIRAWTDAEDPVVLSETKVVGEESGEDGSKWTELDVGLDTVKDRLFTLELEALPSTGAGRVAFGNPELLQEQLTPTPVPHASHVVVVVLSGVDRATLPPWGGSVEMPALARIARASVVYAGYRIKTTLVASVLGTLLTGAGPEVHGVRDPNLGLSENVPILPLSVRRKQGAAGFFTSVPHTFQAFGFGRGWDRHEEYSPVSDIAAIEPFRRAIAFLADPALSDRAARLLVIHARGGHPPWDLTRQETALLPPLDYTGPLEARRGGIVLGELRARATEQRRRLKAEDWTRLRAMQKATLAQQSEALGRVVQELERAGSWAQTMLVVMGDVGMGAPPYPPFELSPPLEETRLLVPLLIRFPGDRQAGVRAQARVTTEDVTRTILLALGVEENHPVSGTDLFGLAQGDTRLDPPPSVALRGDEYSVRRGHWLLAGIRGRTPTLCRLDVDPACASDVFAKFPLAARALWRLALPALEKDAQHAAGTGAPVELDEATGNALRVWGD